MTGDRFGLASRPGHPPLKGADGEFPKATASQLASVKSETSLTGKISDPPGPLADLDHFGDVNEMILDAVPTVETSQFGLLNHSLEIAVIAVAQHFGKITA